MNRSIKFFGLFAFILLFIPVLGCAILRWQLLPYRLVVVIVVDQMRADYLERFRPYFVPGGFNRFLKNGVVFTQARYRHAALYTGASHAGISTGREPKDHGIIGNAWFDPLKKRGMNCVQDPAVQLIGLPERTTSNRTGGASPWLMCSETVGDRLKEKFPNSRVVSLALKDRAAILLGGRKADAALWFDDSTARFVSSTYYPPHPELLAFDKQLPHFFQEKKWWDLSRKIPAAEWNKITFDPKELYAYKKIENMGSTFPHSLDDPLEVITSPCGDELVLQLARFVIENLRLGNNPSRQPDLLYIGLSTPDYYGHMFGPDSKEVADGFISLDESLQQFFFWLDRDIGSKNFLLFLTSDHGVTTIPEVARAKHFAATGRNDANVGGRFDLDLAKNRLISDAAPEELMLEKHLAEKFHYTLDPNAKNSAEGAVLAFSAFCIYLNKSVLSRRRLLIEEVKDAVRDWIKTRPGVFTAYTNTEIANGLPASAPFASEVTRTFYAPRSGDVMIILRPGWMWAYGAEQGTGHEQPWEEDIHVPLLAWGPHVKKGWVDERVSPLSIAKTIGAIFRLKVGADDVEVLKPVLQK